MELNFEHVHHFRVCLSFFSSLGLFFFFFFFCKEFINFLSRVFSNRIPHYCGVRSDVHFIGFLYTAHRPSGCQNRIISAHFDVIEIRGLAQSDYINVAARAAVAAE